MAEPKVTAPTSPYQLVVGDTSNLTAWWNAVVATNPTSQPSISCCGTNVLASVTAAPMPMAEPNVEAKVIDVRKSAP